MQWYEQLFSHYGKTYDNEVFTKGTHGECDFIEQELSYNKDLRILDIGCGTGRHSIELSKRGYSVTGIDLSENMLEHARTKASALSLDIEFKQHDAREPHFLNEFDMVIMLCEGGFSLMETDEMNFAILKNAANALKKNGKFIFTNLNGLFPLFSSVKDFLNSQENENDTTYDDHAFDLMTFRQKGSIEVTDDSGKKQKIDCNERYYVPSEITWMLTCLGFQNIDICGAHLGEFSREHTLTTKDFEMLVIAEK